MYLDGLIEYAEKNNIVLHSKISKAIILSDISFHLRRNPTKNQFYDQEIDGYNIYEYQDEMIPQAKNIDKMEDYLKKFGVHTEYLIDIETSLAVYLYEHQIPTPKEFWTGLRTHVASFIYKLSDAEFESRVPYKISRKDYLLLSSPFPGTEPLRSALCYQSYEDLKKFADTFPQNYKYFPTKRGILRFLENQKISNDQLKEFLIPLCDYPGRKQLVMNNLGVDAYIYRSRTPDVSIILSFPPYWFEQEYLSKSISITDKEKLIETMFIDDNLPITTRKHIWEMLERRDPDLIYYSADLILRSVGWGRITIFQDYKTEGNFSIIHYIKRNELKFELIDQVEVCPDIHDVFYEEHKDFAITYGTFTNFNCFSPEELTAAFIVNPDIVVFRNPRELNTIFSIPLVEDLLEIIHQQRPQDLPNFERRIRPLVRKITMGLNFLNKNQLNIVENEFRKLVGPDREHIIELFEALFRAGMYQRTWKGPGYPFPMKTVETRGSCQKDIEKKMTPELAKIDEEYEKLQDKKLIDKTLLLYSANEIYPQQLMDFVRQTAAGNYCVGGGSGLMIETAYHYLQTLGIDISDFDYQEFEKISTHR
jgi:hypothetical protein